MSQEKILLVEDDENLGYILTEYLELNHFGVIWVKNGKEGLKKIEEEPIGLCLLDIMMPKMDGFELAKRIKSMLPDIPVIFLTAKSLKIDKLKGFKLGADDYITKPVDEEEMLARIRAVLRRTHKPEVHSRDGPATIRIGRFTFDVRKRCLFTGDRAITITGKQADLLEILARNKNQLVTRADALKVIWGKNDYFNRKTMDVHIHKLRKILKEDAGVTINNIHGKGFMLMEKSKKGKT